MKNKIIEAILKAEAEADKIMLEAKEQSAKIILNAELKAEEIKSEAVENSKKYLKTKILESEKQAENDFNLLLEGFKLDASKIETKAKENFEKAIKIINKRI